MAGGFPNVTFGYVGTPAVDLLMASKLQNEKVLNKAAQGELELHVDAVTKRSEHHINTTVSSRFQKPHFCNLEVLGL